MGPEVLDTPALPHTSASPRVRWTEEVLLRQIAERVQLHRQEPSRVLLYSHACLSDPTFRRVYQAARRRVRSGSRDWWAEWLVRAGMNHEEAIQASRCYQRHDASPEGVLREIVKVFRDAECTSRTREPALNGALIVRAERTFGSRRAALKAAKEVLLAQEEYAVGELVVRIESFLPEDSHREDLSRMCLREVAAALGLRGWRTRGKGRSVNNLLSRGLEKGPGIFQRLMAFIVKRGVRYRSHRGIEFRLDCGSLEEPIWREQVEEINAILSSVDLRVPELEDSRFLKRLPVRASRYSRLCPTGDLKIY